MKKQIIQKIKRRNQKKKKKKKYNRPNLTTRLTWDAQREQIAQLLITCIGYVHKLASDRK